VQDHDEHKKKASKTYEHKIKTSRRGRCWVSKTHEHEIKMKEREKCCVSKAYEHEIETKKKKWLLKHMNTKSR